MARIGLMKHRKFRTLARTLGSPVIARGSLELIWDSSHEVLDPLLGTVRDVEELACWKGRKGVLAQALIDSGFLDQAPDGALSVHDYWENAPDYVKKRASRRGSGAKGFPTHTDTRTPDGGHTDAEQTPDGGHTDARDVTGRDGTEEREIPLPPSGDRVELESEAADIWRDCAERIGGVRLTLGIAHTELYQLGEIVTRYSLADVRLAAEHYWRSKRRLKTVAFFRKDFEAELAAAKAEPDEGPRVTAWQCPKCGEEHEGPRKLYLAKWCPHERAEVVA